MSSSISEVEIDIRRHQDRLKEKTSELTTAEHKAQKANQEVEEIKNEISQIQNELQRLESELQRLASSISSDEKKK